MALPMLTINAGVDLAESEAKAVFVAEGEYVESIVTAASLFGGYESAGWTRDIDGHPTTVTAASAFAVATKVFSFVIVQGFVINGEAGSVAESFGVLVRSSSIVTGNRINGGARPTSYGVFHEEGTSLLVNNTIEGGAGSVASYAVKQTGGTMDVIENGIDGGSGDRSFGFVNYGNGSGKANLVGNDIDGGVGETASSAFYCSNSPYLFFHWSPIP
ncbi:MAG: hypothetical protein M5R36_02680 [Deltaproteobacteria bacterium]|nr:hypothetical protein [Deltaproteobacteria bacterium]